MAKATQHLMLNFPPIISFAMISYLEVEESDGDVLNELLGNVLRVKLGAELELQRRLFLYILTQNLESELNYKFGINMTLTHKLWFQRKILSPAMNESFPDVFYN